MTATDPIFLMGPTACGKTELAAALRRRFPLEIVSVDSALVYRGMDIGTAKPDADFLRRAPHRLIDIRDPWEPYSASEFARDAAREIADIRRSGRIPLLVGGTGLYFRALERGLAPLPPADPSLRQELEAEADAVGWPALHAKLRAVDPRAAARIEPGDGQRIQRALEVHRLSGAAISTLQQHRESPVCKPLLKLILAPRDRRALWSRMEQRFLAMLNAGLEAEVGALRRHPQTHSQLPAMRAVGYRQVIAYQEGACDRAEMISRAVAATRQLAKRQMTWLRKELEARWLWVEDGHAVDLAAAAIGAALAGRDAASHSHPASEGSAGPPN